MKRFIGRILICVIPVVVSLLIVGWAYAKYRKAEGGFHLGVDLSGGTILVYEVDQSKMNDQAREDLRRQPELLAASLKRRAAHDLEAGLRNSRASPENHVGADAR